MLLPAHMGHREEKKPAHSPPALPPDCSSMPPRIAINAFILKTGKTPRFQGKSVLRAFYGASEGKPFTDSLMTVPSFLLHPPRPHRSALKG